MNEAEAMKLAVGKDVEQVTREHPEPLMVGDLFWRQHLVLDEKGIVHLTRLGAHVMAACAQTHDLKTWPEFYERIESGEKTFEIRFNDRGFKVGDTLLLREYDPAVSAYTGRSLTRRVTYMVEGPKFGINEGSVVMALAVTEEPQK